MEENKQKRIREAAIDIFSSQGYKETKISDIAEKAFVSVGTIYSYYKGKKELFDSLALEGLEHLKPNYDLRRQGILWKAVDVFGKYGYRATTMDIIASECGFSKATLYQFFNSKEELFSKIFSEQSKTDVKNQFITQISDGQIKDTLFDVGMMFLSMFEDPQKLNLNRMVIAESARFPEIGKTVYENAISVVAGSVSDILRKFCESGEIVCEDTMLAARSYIGMLYSYVVLDRIINTAKETYTSKKIVEFASETFSKGLIKR
jgi:AcrR family transcriptional regulator